jgi:hypothetical protein
MTLTPSKRPLQDEQEHASKRVRNDSEMLQVSHPPTILSVKAESTSEAKLGAMVL